MRTDSRYLRSIRFQAHEPLPYAWLQTPQCPASGEIKEETFPR